MDVGVCCVGMSWNESPMDTVGWLREQSSRKLTKHKYTSSLESFVLSFPHCLPYIKCQEVKKWQTSPRNVRGTVGPHSAGCGWADCHMYCSILIHLRSHWTWHMQLGISVISHSSLRGCIFPMEIVLLPCLFFLYVSLPCVLLGFWEFRGIWLVETCCLPDPGGYFVMSGFLSNGQTSFFHCLRLAVALSFSISEGKRSRENKLSSPSHMFIDCFEISSQEE